MRPAVHAGQQDDVHLREQRLDAVDDLHAAFLNRLRETLEPVRAERQVRAAAFESRGHL